MNKQTVFEQRSSLLLLCILLQFLAQITVSLSLFSILTIAYQQSCIILPPLQIPDIIAMDKWVSCMHLFLINTSNKPQRDLANLTPTLQERNETEFREANNLPKTTRRISSMRSPI